MSSERNRKKPLAERKLDRLTLEVARAVAQVETDPLVAMLSGVTRSALEELGAFNRATMHGPPLDMSWEQVGNRLRKAERRARERSQP